MLFKYSLLKISFITGLTLISFLFIYFLPRLEMIVNFHCPFHLLTGLYCPGCGSLRSLHSLAQGNVIRAFNYNPFTILSLPFLIYSFAAFTYRGISGKELKRIFVKPIYIWLLLVFIIVFWVLRNIPAYPFNILAPHY